MLQVETSSQKLQVGDVELHLTRSGRGFPLVWLHGSGPGASGMSNFKGNLPAFQDFENLVFDHPRFGESSRPHIEKPLISYSGEKILQALRELGLEKVDLIGNSYGGGVAAWIAATAPELVRNLVLMAPGGLTPKDITEHREMPYGIKLIGRAMTEGVDRPLMEEFVQAMIHDPALVDDELIDERYQAALKNNPEIEGIPVMGDLADVLGAITARTLLIWGGEDRFLPPAWSLLWLEAIADSELHIYPRCGHWAQYEQIDSFNELTGNFLRRTA